MDTWWELVVLLAVVLNNLVEVFECANNESDSDSANSASYRLPREVIPKHYDLLVNTYLGEDGEGFRFDGAVNIIVQSTGTSNRITLHSKDLVIDEGNVSVTDLTTDLPLPISSIEYDLLNDFLIIQTSQQLLPESRYKVHIPFEAELKKDVVGYYRSSYQDSESQERVWLSITQFQAIHARRAFPCFDEPELKATFNISLGHHSRYNALSNMPTLGSETILDGRPNWTVDHFERSVLMATYLVSYSINDYLFAEAVGGNTSNGVQVRSWSRKEAVGNLGYANEIALKLIDLYEGAFDLRFPLPKLDFISIPDMLFAAMENWGLVTFTEAGLEFSRRESTLDDQHFVASVVAHEIAHMWFGNLVTMRWWTDLWLNEGFARYTEFKAVEYLHPEMRSLQEIVIEDVLEIFKFDALNSSHRVSIEIGNPEEIPQLFDSISYKKGSAIVRMINLFLGEEVYNGGVSRYLKRFQFSNAEQDDLWQALTEEAQEDGRFPDGFDVKAVMDTWTLQTGYPVVYVERDYQRGTMTFRQMRFIYDETIDDPACWWIPLTVSTSLNPDFNQTQPQLWLGCTPQSTPIVTNLPCNTEWVMINNQMAGLYKVQYDYNNYRLIARYLNTQNFRKINAINRAQLIDDALDFSWAGLQDYSIAFSILDYLPTETEYIPWKAALTNLNSLDRVLSTTDHYDLFLAYVTRLLLPLYNHLNIFHNTSIPSSLGQTRLTKLTADWACSMDFSDCVQNSLQLFTTWITSSSNPIPPELRTTVYCTAIREGTLREWDFLWERYRGPVTGSAERTAIAEGLACTEDPELMDRLLRWSVDLSSELRLEDTTVVFEAIADQVGGTAMAKQFLFDNIDKMADYVNPETFESRLASHVKVLARKITARDELDQLERFVARKGSVLAGNSIAIGQALELARINIQWVENQLGGFVAYLRLLERSGFDASRMEWF
ncbi:aminopeptidase N-like [Culex pipiens pallens]|uniref:aminopeptidase N-like n=1 Tax=Culex pipiens pallens TaxID=42434 RepID=UPI0019549B5A|nr:aminopeptidase N-like [Culex pipiens pallens]